MYALMYSVCLLETRDQQWVFHKMNRIESYSFILISISSNPHLNMQSLKLLIILIILNNTYDVWCWFRLFITQHIQRLPNNFCFWKCFKNKQLFASHTLVLYSAHYWQHKTDWFQLSCPFIQGPPYNFLKML